MKRYLIICLIGLFLITPLFRVDVKANETGKKAEGQFYNLVLFISFSDTESDYWDGKGREINTIYNTTERYNALCVSDYFNLASCEPQQ